MNPSKDRTPPSASLKIKSDQASPNDASARAIEQFSRANEGSRIPVIFLI